MQDVVLILPAYNEGDRLERVLGGVAAAGIDCEVVVVDDGSRDATAAVARRCGATVLRHPFNLGYGAALQTGYKYALRHGFALLVQMDADGQHDPKEIARLLDLVRSGECDLAIGSRFLGKGDYRMSALHDLGRQVFRAIARGFGLRVSDPTSGYQAMNLKVLELYARDFFPADYPDVDVLLAATRHGLRIQECAVHMSEGQRASTLHGGLRSFYYVYKMLLSTWSASARRRRARSE